MRFNEGLECFNLGWGKILVFRNQEEKRTTVPTSRDKLISLNIHNNLVYFVTNTIENTGSVVIVQVNLYIFLKISFLCFSESK